MDPRRNEDPGQKPLEVPQVGGLKQHISLLVKRYICECLRDFTLKHSAAGSLAFTLIIRGCMLVVCKIYKFCTRTRCFYDNRNSAKRYLYNILLKYSRYFSRMQMEQAPSAFCVCVQMLQHLNTISATPSRLSH